MKKIVILAALLITMSVTAYSQEPEYSGNNQRKKEYREPKEQREFQTLLGHNRPGGAYGSFSMGYSLIDNRDAVLIGGRFAWIASHSIGFGFGGLGFINEFHYEPLVQRDVALAGGYGGFYIEPILMPRFPVHLSFPTLFGAGGISYVSQNSLNDNNLIEDSEGFLIVEPGAEIELNLTRYFRFSMGAFYRYTSPFNIGTTGTELAGAESLKGWSYMLTLKFGKF